MNKKEEAYFPKLKFVNSQRSLGRIMADIEKKTCLPYSLSLSLFLSWKSQTGIQDQF